MPLPDSVARVTVIEDYTNAATEDRSGTITFTPAVRVVVEGTTITVDPVVAHVVDGVLLGPDGKNPLRLVANDSPGISPTGWTYRVEPNIGRERTVRNIVLPSTPDTVVLHTLAPVDPVTPGVVQVRTVGGVGPDATGDIPVSALEGPPGEDGPPGNAATVTVGTVTTGIPGSPATVTNSGTSAAALLDFTIPRGTPGLPGADGEDGEDGVAGADGQAATVAIGSVSTGAPGSAASVTNSGTPTAAVLDFAIPRGAAGADGAAGPPGASGLSGELYPPDAAGRAEWNIDPAFCTTSWPLNSGVLILIRMRFRQAVTLDELGFVVTQAGITPGAYSGVGVYEDGSGVVTRLAQSADAGASFTSLGTKSIALGAPVTIPAGEYRRVGVLWQGGSPPRIAGAPATVVDEVMNLGVRRCTFASGQTGFPAALTVSAMSLNNASYLVTARDT